MADREVELFDYLSVLWRWKWLIVLMTLASMLIAGLVTWRMPRTYRVTATIDTGDLSEARDRNVERLVARVNAKASAQAEGGARPVPFTVQFRRPALIELVSETQVPGEAMTNLQQAAAEIVGDLNRLLELQRVEEEAKIRAIQDQLDELEDVRQRRRQRVEELHRSLDRLHRALAEARRREDPPSSLVAIRLSEVIVALENELVTERRKANESPAKVEELKRRIDWMTQQMASPHPAQLLSSPQVPSMPIRPRPRLNLAVSLTAGLLGSVMLVLVVDYVRRAGAQAREG